MKLFRMLRSKKKGQAFGRSKKDREDLKFFQEFTNLHKDQFPPDFPKSNIQMIPGYEERISTAVHEVIESLQASKRERERQLSKESSQNPVNFPL